MKKIKQLVRFRRRRNGYTDYRKRLKLLMSKKTRLIIRKSLNDLTLQICEYKNEGDKIVVGARASELKKYGWSGNTGNIPTAYLAGQLLAEKVKKAKVNECIVDIGFNKSVKGSRIYAALKGAADGGVKVHFSEEKMPEENRINGKHIADYAAKLKKEDNEKYNKVFSSYVKKNTLPEQIPEMFNKVKEALKKAK